MKFLLDSNVLGKICHPRKHGDVRGWFLRAAVRHDFLLPEVADYELRRELLHIGSRRSIARLDELTRELRYLPVTTSTWRDAARLWAEMRRAGTPTGSEIGLDADMILAALALAEGAAIVTSNVRHLSRLVVAMDWMDVPLS